MSLPLYHQERYFESGQSFSSFSQPNVSQFMGHGEHLRRFGIGAIDEYER